MPGPLSLVIFDCDGVLVDSERLSVRVEGEILSELGWPLTPDEIVARFVGRTEAHMHAEVERHLGHPVDWDQVFAPRYRAAFEAELTPVPGIEAVLDALLVPSCVASSGTHERMRMTLGLTGLWPRFDGRIFSATEVARGKPAPDVFLHAARRMGVKPSRCAVVEDSASGVAAGRAAGMSVYAFASGVTRAEQLAADGVEVFEEMAELQALLAARSAARRPALA